MRILAYDEVDPEGVKIVNWACFRWLLTPEIARELRDRDPWLPERFALYAVEGGEVLAQTGTCVVDTRTVDGTERVGFIWGVSTRPDSARRGYARALIEESHRLLLEEDIRFTVLGTSRSFVAYDLYHDMGYRDLGHFRRAIKRCGVPVVTDVVCEEGLTEGDAHRIFSRYAEGLLGFVHRFEGIVGVREMNFHDGPYLRCTFTRHGEGIGFAIGRSAEDHINLIDITCVDVDDIPACVAALERTYEPDHVMFDLTPRWTIMDRLAIAGFTPIDLTWDRLMAADLTGDLDIDGIEEVYGVSEDLFTMSELDAY